MKSLFTARPVFTVCTVFFVASLLSAGIPSEAKLILILSLIAAAFVAAIFAFLKPAKRNLFKIITAICLTVSFSFGLTYLTVDREASSCEALVGQTAECTVTISKVVYSAEYYGIYYAEASGTDGSFDVKICLSYPDGSAVTGDIFKGSVTFSGLDEEDGYYASKERIFLSAEAEGLEYSGRVKSASLTDRLREINSALNAQLQAAADGKAPLTGAILLGNTKQLSAAVKRDFSRLGISHLFAISGLHMSIVVAFVDALLSKTRLKRGLRALLTALAIISFMAITGFGISVVRSGLMHLLCLASASLGRRSDPLTSLAAAASIIILADPFSVFDTALLLSVLASYACICYPKIHLRRKTTSRPSLLKRILSDSIQTAKMSSFIIAVTLPFTVGMVGGLPILAPICNVVFVPLTGILLQLGMILLPLCSVPLLSDLLSMAVAGLERLIVFSAGVISSLPHIVLPLTSVISRVLIIIVFLMSLTLVIVVGKHRAISKIGLKICATLLLVCGVVTLVQGSCTSSVVFSTAGKNEALIIRDGLSTVAIDISSGGLSAVSEGLTVEGSLKGGEISALVLTHYHQRHISGVTSICDKAIVREVLLPSPESSSEIEICEDLMDLCAARGIDISFYSRADGEAFTLGGVRLNFKDHTHLSRSSHPIVSLGFDLGGVRYLYMVGSAPEGMNISLDGVDTVFIGAHPPVSKSVVSALAEATVIVASGAADAVPEGADVILEPDSFYLETRGK